MFVLIIIVGLVSSGMGVQSVDFTSAKACDAAAATLRARLAAGPVNGRGFDVFCVSKGA